MGAILLLEDGRKFTGEAFGAETTRVGEAVFNTAMTGYQEVLTDPSYAEQVVIMTAAHVGNTGVNQPDAESDRVWTAGFVARSFSHAPSSWRSTGGLHQYLANRGVPGLHGVDTRALVRHLRSKGAMRCAISTDGRSEVELAQMIRAWPGMDGRDLASEVSCTEPWTYCDPLRPRLRVSVVDGGCKLNILRSLQSAGCAVQVHPLHGSAESWMSGADLVLVSNGPGDPAAIHGVVEELTKVSDAGVPVVGICLGSQLLARALGATTYKLKFGHRGANQPVRVVSTGKVEITSQNHGFAVDRASLEATGATVTHVHLNDQTVSGFAHMGRRVFAVQFHPEACPGPKDSAHLLTEQFLQFAEEAVR